MNKLKLFGMCIVFLLAVVSVNAAVNETLLNNLLDTYGSSYDNGQFIVTLQNYNYTRILVIEPGAGNSTAMIDVSGPGTLEEYTIVAALSVELDGEPEWVAWNPDPLKYLDGKLIRNVTKTGANISEIFFNGIYYIAPDPLFDENIFILDVKIYQGGILQNQKEFKITNKHETKAILLDIFFDLNGASPTKAPVLTAAKDAVILNISMYFAQGGNYTIGAYLTDNKTETTYAEAVVSVPNYWNPSYVEKNTIWGGGGQGFYIEKNVSIRFNSDLFREFDLNNEKIYLKAVSVDGNIMEYSRYHTSVDGQITDLISEYNGYLPSSLFTTATSFAFSDIYVTGYSFDTSSKNANGKIKELGVTLSAIYVNNPPYDLELSLENEYGEVIELKQGTINGASTSIKFNGTNIYNSKINGPYRIGFVRITKAGNELLYKLDTASTADLNYMNFTSPDMPDLKINDTDVTNDGTNVTLTVYNKAAGDAAGITISLFDNSAVKKGEAIIDKIVSGGNQNYTFTNVGLATAFVVVDFSNKIEETNESNNIASAVSPNSAPVLASIGPKSTPENVLLQFIISATDNDPDPLTLTAANLPTGASFADNGDNTGTFTWTPGFTQAGVYSVQFNVTDGLAIASEIVTIIITDSNRAPAITSASSAAATRGISYTYVVTAADPDTDDTLTYSASNLPAGAVFTPAARTFSWTPSNAQYGSFTPRFTVNDGTVNVNKDVTISMKEDVYSLKAATLDFNQRELGYYVFIDSQISIGMQIQNSASSTPAVLTVNADTGVTITHSAAGYQSDSDYIYFDARLASCIAGTNCVLPGAYTTSCAWEAAYNNWYCGVLGGLLPKQTWFRYDRNPSQYLKRVNYLIPS